ncbi:hypothetical protein [Chitinophaga arvensicola]|uniref:DUF1640 domain-containing protein n=1 Tax=Chitinophaga arvensicola TaxID=29529 RepID=A0A1I0S5J0_9BACT|nr:hypothetical protein [Chitinophaga arvensicola]SEW50398.1 hypothetical protein SAMN04488122_3788 [Chitinophaga arvensicola]
MIGNLKLYDLFRKDLHLSDDKAMEVVNALDEHYERKSSSKIEQLATKAELQAVKSELKEEIHTIASRLDLMATKEELLNVKSELKEDIGKVRMEFKEDISKFRVEFKGELKDLENKLVKHTHSATIVQYVLLIGSIAALLRYAGVIR